ncbi:MAG: short chain dehydrogenase [Geminicoccaceae bacterium]|nr:short chain dehydrogenase [Geminicoccaceae bacterium]
MRVVVVGGTGTIGRAVVAELGRRHEVVRAARTGGEVQLDATDPASIRAGLAKIGRFDALVATMGEVAFAPLAKLDTEAFAVGWRSKLMGQIQLVLVGREFVAENGSFTLTSGILGRDPVIGGSAASLVNGALEAWVRAAAIELLPERLRINCVSPGLLEETALKAGAFFPGHVPVSAARVARAYAKSVEGAQTGQIYEVF